MKKNTNVLVVLENDELENQKELLESLNLCTKNKVFAMVPRDTFIMRREYVKLILNFVESPEELQEATNNLYCLGLNGDISVLGLETPELVPTNVEKILRMIAPTVCEDYNKYIKGIQRRKEGKEAKERAKLEEQAAQAAKPQLPTSQPSKAVQPQAAAQLAVAATPPPISDNVADINRGNAAAEEVYYKGKTYKPQKLTEEEVNEITGFVPPPPPSEPLTPQERETRRQTFLRLQSQREIQAKKILENFEEEKPNYNLEDW